MRESVKLRIATLDDAERLLQWRNDEETRRFSLNPAAITKQQHMSWLEQSLADPQRRLFIAEHANQPIGTVRVDSTALGQFISWNLAPEFRGKGLGKAMVKSLVNTLKGKVIAEILPGNITSVKAAQYAGLTYKNTRNGIMYYECEKPY